MINQRLSSNNLYHFKNDYKVIEFILKDGFRHTKWDESIPYKKSQQQNFMVCFCDIKIEDSLSHRDCYGNNAIVLTKDWGIKNGISPVRYIHENSHGISQDYIQSKNRFREIRQNAKDHPDTVIHDYAIFSVLKDFNKLSHDTLQDDINANPNLGSEMTKLEQELSTIIAIANSQQKGTDLAKFIRSLLNRIYELHNELEKRDSFMRIYKDNFTHPSTNITIHDKILYDEKEWRSIKYADKVDFAQATANGFLPVKYNLLFTDDDLIAILLEDKSKMDSLIDFLNTNKTIVDSNKTISKIELIDNYKE